MLSKVAIHCLLSLMAVTSAWAYSVVYSCVQPGDFALTFDDGPAAPTPELLDTLLARNIKATFFVVGERIFGDQAQYMARAAREGHEIESHTFSHTSLLGLTTSQITAEMSSTEEAILDFTGRRPTRMRPPYGEWDERVARHLESIGYGTIVMWNLDSEDWRYQATDPERIITNVETILNRGSPSTNSYIGIFHDLHLNSVRIMPRVIDLIASRGYRFVTLSQCLGQTVPTNCGNGICEPSESCSTCPQDCGACPTCGDGICSPSETCTSCPADCGTCPSNCPIPGSSVTATLVSQWSSGAEYAVTIRNGNAPLNGWKVSFVPPSGLAISSIWNARLAPSEGGRIVAVNESWNAALGAGQSVSIGFIVSKPSSLDLNANPPTGFQVCAL